MMVVLTFTAGVRAQGWAADVSAGRLVYDPASIDLGTSILMGPLRYDSQRNMWVYGTVSLPGGGDGTFWTAAGTGGRLLFPVSVENRVSVGADVGGHAFSFNDRLVDLTGTGGSLDALPFVRKEAGAGFVEGRAGWRGQTLSFAGVRDTRSVFETGARAGYGATVRVEGDARLVHATEGTFPFVGATMMYVAPRVEVWGHTGRWLHSSHDAGVWGFGSAVSLSLRTSVWGSVRQDASDPLYWNSPRRSWNVGLTHRLGRITPPPITVATTPAGTVAIRLSAADAPQGAVRIAGDFNNWQTVPMQREGDDWVIRLPLAAGVYHYTFNAANGDWFVPASTPGRRDDGFGGHVAVLVVN